jgi:hypothetical protein
LIPPQDSGLLFSLPIELPATPPRWIAADSVSVHASALQTRLSTDHGNLVEHLEFREARAPITNCTGTAYGRR